MNPMQRLLGDSTEVQLFADLFKHMPAAKFALIKISGATLAKHMDQLTTDIAFLNKLGVHPVIVHGAGKELDKLLPHSKKVDGIRATPEEDMAIIKEVMQQINLQLTLGIVEKGGRAMGLTDVIEAIPMEGYGQVGSVGSVDVSTIQKVIASNATPVICPLGTYGSKTYNINADTAAKGIVDALGPRKFIMLTETGGVLDDQGQIVPFLNLSSDLDDLPISGGMLLKVKEVQQFLSQAKGCEVVITSAPGLLKEIFTVKGHGTILKYHEIQTAVEIDEKMKIQIKKTLEDAFGKELVPGHLDTDSLELVHQVDFEGLALIKPMDGYAYLDKFAVGRPFQGTGLGKCLWKVIEKKYPALLWRSSKDNPFNQFYQTNCDGMVKMDPWTIYWRGMDHYTAMDLIGTVANIDVSMLPMEVTVDV